MGSLIIQKPVKATFLPDFSVGGGGKEAYKRLMSLVNGHMKDDGHDFADRTTIEEISRLPGRWVDHSFDETLGQNVTWNSTVQDFSILPQNSTSFVRGGRVPSPPCLSTFGRSLAPDKQTEPQTFRVPRLRDKKINKNSMFETEPLLHSDENCDAPAK